MYNPNLPTVEQMEAMIEESMKKPSFDIEIRDGKPYFYKSREKKKIDKKPRGVVK